MWEESHQKGDLGNPRHGRATGSTCWGTGEEGCAYLATEVWPHPRQKSNPGWAVPAAVHATWLPCAGWPFSNPLSHTGCQEDEDPRIQALPQPLPLALCLAEARAAKGPGSPLHGSRGQLPAPSGLPPHLAPKESNVQLRIRAAATSWGCVQTPSLLLAGRGKLASD